MNLIRENIKMVKEKPHIFYSEKDKHLCRNCLLKCCYFGDSVKQWCIQCISNTPINFPPGESSYKLPTKPRETVTTLNIAIVERESGGELAVPLG